MVLWIICKVMRRSAPLPARAQDTQRPGHAIAGAGRDGAGTGEGGVCRTLGIEIVARALPPTILSIGGGHLQQLDSSQMQKAGQVGTIAAGQRDPDAARRTHPDPPLPIALSSRAETR